MSKIESVNMGLGAPLDDLITFISPLEEAMIIAAVILLTLAIMTYAFLWLAYNVAIFVLQEYFPSVFTTLEGLKDTYLQPALDFITSLDTYLETIFGNSNYILQTVANFATYVYNLVFDTEINVSIPLPTLAIFDDIGFTSIFLMLWYFIPMITWLVIEDNLAWYNLLALSIGQMIHLYHSVYAFLVRSESDNAWSTNGWVRLYMFYYSLFTMLILSFGGYIVSQVVITDFFKYMLEPIYTPAIFGNEQIDWGAWAPFMVWMGKVALILLPALMPQTYLIAEYEASRPTNNIFSINIGELVI